MNGWSSTSRSGRRVARSMSRRCSSFTMAGLRRRFHVSVVVRATCLRADYRIGSAPIPSWDRHRVSRCNAAGRVGTPGAGDRHRREVCAASPAAHPQDGHVELGVPSKLWTTGRGTRTGSVQARHRPPPRRCGSSPGRLDRALAGCAGPQAGDVAGLTSGGARSAVAGPAPRRRKHEKPRSSPDLSPRPAWSTQSSAAPLVEGTSAEPRFTCWDGGIRRTRPLHPQDVGSMASSQAPGTSAHFPDGVSTLGVRASFGSCGPRAVPAAALPCHFRELDAPVRADQSEPSIGLRVQGDCTDRHGTPPSSIGRPGGTRAASEPSGLHCVLTAGPR